MTDNRMSDLEWLAQNYSDWEFTDKDYVYKGPEGVAWFTNEPSTSIPTYTKDQWQAERQRLGLDTPEWDGEGWPPAGTECEYDFNMFQSEEFIPGHVKFIAEDNGKAVVKQVGANEAYFATTLHCLRPLKSQEQRGREEVIESALRSINQNYGDGCIWKRANIPDRYVRDAVEQLYDAGMLKKPD